MNRSVQSGPSGPPGSSGHPPRARIILAFAVIYLVWGSTFLAIRIGLETIPPFFLAGGRFLIAGSILYTLVRARGTAAPVRKQWITATIAGALLFVGGNGSLVWAEQWVPSGLAAIVLGMIPLWMVLLDSFREGGPRLTPRVVAGLLIGLAGVGILVGPAELFGSARVDLMGAALLMFSAFCWAVGSLYSRSARLPDSPFQAAAMEMLAGGSILILMGLLFELRHLHTHTVSARSIAGIIYLAVLGSLVGFSAYIWLLRVVPTSRVATYAYVNPIVAVLIGWAAGDGPLTAREVLAAAIIVGAVVLILSHQPQPVAMAPDTDGLPTLEEEESMRRGRE